MSRYISPHPKPTAHERELLTVLAEEANEIGVAVSKLIRFGANDGYPGSGIKNSTALGREIGDLLHVVERLVGLGVIHIGDIDEGKARKAEKLPLFLQTDPPELCEEP